MACSLSCLGRLSFRFGGGVDLKLCLNPAMSPRHVGRAGSRYSPVPGVGATGWTSGRSTSSPRLWHPGVNSSEIARGREINPQQMFRWRGRFREQAEALLGSTHGSAGPTSFAPLLIEASTMPGACPTTPAKANGAGESGIEVGVGGVTLRIRAFDRRPAPVRCHYISEISIGGIRDKRCLA